MKTIRILSLLLLTSLVTAACGGPTELVSSDASTTTAVEEHAAALSCYEPTGHYGMQWIQSVDGCGNQGGPYTTTDTLTGSNGSWAWTETLGADVETYRCTPVGAVSTLPCALNCYPVNPPGGAVTVKIYLSPSVDSNGAQHMYGQYTYDYRTTGYSCHSATNGYSTSYSR